ncbi:MAG: AAA family ATPase [Xanthomonadaceae bacterium]|nr:AAA family ATPase [Xanthomonadaceae bacterium]
MLHSYAFRNFLSFRERTEVSFVLTRKASAQGWDTTSPAGQRLAKAMAVVGANGAGKTSLIKPLAFLSWFITHSFQSQPNAPLPVKPHFSSPNEPVEFEVEADDMDGTLWRYELKATPERVLHEAMYRRPKKKSAKFSYVFVRVWNQAEKEYAIKQDGFDLNPAEAKKVRPNASLISTAAQYGVEVAQHLIGANVSSNIQQVGRVDPNLGFFSASIFFHENVALKRQMESLLHDLDFGLSGVEIRKQDIAVPPEMKLPDGTKLPSQYQVIGVHTLKDGSRHELQMMEESSGTRTAFTQLWYLLSVLATGGIAVIDELESDMHPHMIEPLLDLFASPHTNPHNAQIIFTSHSIEVMGLLGKSQIFLVEKKDCESEAWRLDTMDGVRVQDNLYAKYMSGAYGAVPQL